MGLNFVFNIVHLSLQMRFGRGYFPYIFGWKARRLDGVPVPCAHIFKERTRNC